MKAVFLCFGILILSLTASSSELDVLLQIQFPSGGFEIPEPQKVVVVELKGLIKNSPSVQVYITGHTDSLGAEDFNLKLSNQRAQSIYNELKSIGMKGEAAVVKGMGESAPLAPNDTLEGRATNRRVVAIFTGLDAKQALVLRRLAEKAPGLKVLNVESEIEKNYIRLEEEKRLKKVTLLEKKTPAIEKEKTIPKKNKKSNFKRHKVYVESNSFHADIEAQGEGTDRGLDELLSNVSLALRLQYEYFLSSKLSFAGTVGGRHYEYSQNLDRSMNSDQEKVALNFGLGMKHRTFSWLRNEIWLSWYQQMYFRDKQIGSLMDWAVELAGVLRLDISPVLIPFDSQNFDVELGPIFSLFTGVLGSASNLNQGYSLGVYGATHFLWKKRIGLGVRYQKAFFTSEDMTRWKVNQEDLELQFRMQFVF